MNPNSPAAYALRGLKHVSHIARDFKEAAKTKGPERLSAVRACWNSLVAYEKALAGDPTFGSYHEVQELRELTVLVQAALNRLEAGNRKRQENEKNG